VSAHKLNEDEILKLFRRELGLSKPHALNITGNTDDAAVMPLLSSLFSLHAKSVPHSRSSLADGIVMTVDGMVEGVHFRLDNCTPADVAAKCMAVNLSDLAAMGASPLGALVYVGLPGKYANAEFARILSAGLKASMRKHGYTIFGGDLTRARDMTISAALIGKASCQRLLTRSGACIGDTVFLSGQVGLASLGLKLMDARRTRKRSVPYASYPKAFQRAKLPAPRLQIGIRLAESGLATSCIDLSDSLSKSLYLIAEESGVGIEVTLSPQMLHPEVRRYYGRLDGIELMRAVFSAEEDFELLFTANAESADELGLPSRQAIPIGRVVAASKGVQAVVGNARFDIPMLGYQHFGR
jgi:thiamine-monophosphate kinase